MKDYPDNVHCVIRRQVADTLELLQNYVLFRVDYKSSDHPSCLPDQAEVSLPFSDKISCLQFDSVNRPCTYEAWQFLAAKYTERMVIHQPRPGLKLTRSEMWWSDLLQA